MQVLIMPFQPLEEIYCNLPVYTAVTASRHGCSTSKNFFGPLL